MAVSILHRVTGAGVALVGAGLFTWWLLAAAAGPDSYATFAGWAAWKWALIIWIPLSWGLFQHLFSGVRHFVLDIGAGYELETNKRWAWATIAGSVILTAALWAWILYGRAA